MKTKKHKIFLSTLTLLTAVVFSFAISMYINAQSKPNPGHSWGEIICDSTLCVNTSTGRVGVGTTSPAYKLDVTGDIRATNFIGAFSGGSSGGFTVTGPADATGGLTVNATGQDSVRLWTGSDNVATIGRGTSRHINIDLSGKVGIGTTTPLGIFHVQTGGSGTWNRFVVKTTSFWGDGTSVPSETAGTQQVTIGAQANGIMIYNPHVTWREENAAAAVTCGLYIIIPLA